MGGVSWIFLGIFLVPNVFNSSFQSAPQVPYVFLDMFPIATHFVPYALLNVGLLYTWWANSIHVSMVGMNTSSTKFQNFHVMGKSKRPIATPPKKKIGFFRKLFL
jgi:hypothetical protein